MKAKEVKQTLVASVQVHICRENACLYLNKRGEWVCKRQVPFDLLNDDFVEEDGTWGVKRFYPYFNTWNPGLLQCVRSKHNIKIITNSSDTKI